MPLKMVVFQVALAGFLMGWTSPPGQSAPDKGPFLRLQLENVRVANQFQFGFIRNPPFDLQLDGFNWQKQRGDWLLRPEPMPYQVRLNLKSNMGHAGGRSLSDSYELSLYHSDLISDLDPWVAFDAEFYGH